MVFSAMVLSVVVMLNSTSVILMVMPASTSAVPALVGNGSKKLLRLY